MWYMNYIKTEVPRHNSPELTDLVTRVEVIDGDWRSYVNMHTDNVKISIQDDWRTLKIFCD